MVTDKTEKFWDSLASGFDRNSKYFPPPSIEKTKKHLHKSHRVLDFGCATGNEAIEISWMVKEVVGIDISSKMIAFAKSKAEKLELKNVHFEQSTLFEKSHKPTSYDVILMFNILHLFSDTKAVLQRAYELLKPEGLIIIVTACAGEKKFINFLQSIILVPLIKIGKVPYMQFFKPHDLNNLLADTGFKIVEFEKLNKSSNYFIVAQKEK